MSVEKSSSEYYGLIWLLQPKVILLVPWIKMTTTTISLKSTTDYFLGKLKFSEHLKRSIRKVIVILIRNWVHFLNNCLHCHHHLQKKTYEKLNVVSHFQQRLVWWLFQSLWHLDLVHLLIKKMSYLVWNHQDQQTIQKHILFW